MSKMEKRTIVKKSCVRSNEQNGERWIEGLIPYNKKSVDLGGFLEIITPSAFKKTLGDKANVYALFAHDQTKVLGATRSNTLILEDSEEGLICKCKLGNSTWANDAWDSISRGDNVQMSFGFIPYKVRSEKNIDYLESVKLEEVSFCVSNPAYEDTTSTTALRSLEDIKRAFAELSAEDKENFVNTTLKNEEEENMTLTDEDFEKIVNAVVEKLKADENETKEVDQKEQTEEVTLEETTTEAPEVVTKENERAEAEATESDDSNNETPVLVDDEENKKREEEKAKKEELENLLNAIDEEVN